MATRTEKEFSFRLVTQGRPFLDTRVTEVVLPAFDGEVGILSGHVDFVGLVGTGLLKVVQNGDDFWYMVSSGVFQVEDGEVMVLVEIAEDARTVDLESSRAALRSLELELERDLSTEDRARITLEYNRVRARIEAHRRTHLLN